MLGDSAVAFDLVGAMTDDTDVATDISFLGHDAIHGRRAGLHLTTAKYDLDTQHRACLLYTSDAADE